MGTGAWSLFLLIGSLFPEKQNKFLFTRRLMPLLCRFRRIEND